MHHNNISTRQLSITCCAICLFANLFGFTYNGSVVATETFTSPGIPTLDYVGAREYAKSKNTIVAFFKLREGCASSLIEALNGYDMRSKYATLDIPIVAGSIYGFKYSDVAWDNIPPFFEKVIAGYYTADGPCDIVIEDQNDSVQKGVSTGCGRLNNWGKLSTGKSREEKEWKYNFDTDDLYYDIKRVLYSRDDTAYNKLRTSFGEYTDINGQTHTSLNHYAWKYTTRPRIINWLKNSQTYVHGLIDHIGTEAVAPNCLMHVARSDTYSIRTYDGPIDAGKTTHTFVRYYDNLQDWYLIKNLITNYTYSIKISNLLDPDGDGVIYHFDNSTSASFSTNITECMSHCTKSARMMDSISGFTFNANGEGDAYICFGLTNTEELEIKASSDDRTVKNKIVRYMFTLSGSERKPEPTPVTPEDSTPQYNTNVFVIASLSDLVYEGGTSDPESYEVSIDRKTPATGSLSIHMVVDDIQKGLASWSDGESGVKEMSYQFPLDPEYNTDTSHDVIFKNYFMKLSHPVTVRDACVKYSATEYSYYNDDGISMYPLSGDWFVNKDDVFQCHTTDASTNATIVSLCLQPTKSGTMHITSDATDATVSVYDTYTSSNVKETNYIYYDDRNIYIKNTDSHVHKQPSGSATVIYKTTSSISFNTDSNKVIRIDAKSGTKFPTFELVR